MRGLQGGRGVRDCIANVPSSLLELQFTESKGERLFARIAGGRGVRDCIENVPSSLLELQLTEEL